MTETHKISTKWNEKINNLYILGAGFDKAIHDDSPLNDELKHKLVTYIYEKNKKKSSSDFEEVLDYLIAHDFISIELILTELDIEDKKVSKLLSACSDKATKEALSRSEGKLKRIRENISKYICEYFKESFNVSENHLKSKDWLSIFCSQVLQEDDVIIDLNYTSWLLTALDINREWSPLGGLGTRIFGADGFFDEDPPENVVHRKNVRILKLHGCVEFNEQEYSSQKKAPPTFIGINLNKNIFPVSCEHRDHEVIGKYIREYIILPSYLKTYHLDLHRQFLDVLRLAYNAKNLLVLGCGLREEDTSLLQIITNFFEGIVQEERKNSKFILLDSHADEIYKGLASYHDMMCGKYLDSYGKKIGYPICIKSMDMLMKELNDRALTPQEITSKV